VLNAKQRDAASQAQQPDGLAANGGGCDRIPLRRASISRKITPNGPGIWGISAKNFASVNYLTPIYLTLNHVTERRRVGWRIRSDLTHPLQGPDYRKTKGTSERRR
jgi:hypothetical protein